MLDTNWSREQNFGASLNLNLLRAGLSGHCVGMINLWVDKSFM